MKRSTVESWLQGQGDLKEETVEDVPVPGESVLVRGLPAKFSAEVQAQMKVSTEGRESVARLDVDKMELLQFKHGVVEPQFTLEQTRLVQEKYGPAFRKVIDVVDRLSGVTKEDIAQAEVRFPDSGEAPDDNGRGELGAAVADPPGARS